MERSSREQEAKKSRSSVIGEAKEKAARYCAYQERTKQEVREKLQRLGLNTAETEKIIMELLGEGFIDEERYAIAYTRGKFYQNKWGKMKIEFGLRKKGISELHCKKAFEEISEKEYERVVKDLINRKDQQIKTQDIYIRKNKIANHLISKGFEREIIWRIINDYITG